MERRKAMGGNAALLFLLPLFFVSHGVFEHYGLVPFWDAVGLLLFYYGIALALAALSYPLFRSWRKAAVFVLFLLTVHFFFGWAHDGLKKFLGPSFVTRYTFLLPLVIVGIVAFLFYVRKQKASFRTAVRFVSFLFPVLIAVDVAVWLAARAPNASTDSEDLRGLVACDTCSKPDVYFIVADEYAGSEALKEVFSYDNSSFERALETLGFRVVQRSRSNYNFTPFSIASTLNMEYLALKDTGHTATDVPMVMSRIEDNLVTRFFYSNGYQVVNNSVFDLPREPKKVKSSFLPDKTRYITAQTLLSRLDRDLFYHLIASLKLKSVIRKGMYHNLENNEVLYQQTVNASMRTGKPKFVYTHLSLPHPPYYFNSKGQPNSYEQLFDNGNKVLYLEYLKWSNKKLLDLVTAILQNSARPPVIFLVSDHGFREAERRYQFVNFIAVYTAGKGESAYYDGLSSVNLFRVLLREQFQQQVPLLKDSLIFLRD